MRFDKDIEAIIPEQIQTPAPTKPTLAEPAPITLKPGARYIPKLSDYSESSSYVPEPGIRSEPKQKESSKKRKLAATEVEQDQAAVVSQVSKPDSSDMPTFPSTFPTDRTNPFLSAPRNPIFYDPFLFKPENSSANLVPIPEASLYLLAQACFFSALPRQGSSASTAHSALETANPSTFFFSRVDSPAPSTLKNEFSCI